jgi:hypothetical protein
MLRPPKLPDLLHPQIVSRPKRGFLTIPSHPALKKGHSTELKIYNPTTCRA